LINDTGPGNQSECRGFATSVVRGHAGADQLYRQRGQGLRELDGGTGIPHDKIGEEFGERLPG